MILFTRILWNHHYQTAQARNPVEVGFESEAAGRGRLSLCYFWVDKRYILDKYCLEV